MSAPTRKYPVVAGCPLRDGGVSYGLRFWSYFRTLGIIFWLGSRLRCIQLPHQFADADAGGPTCNFVPPALKLMHAAAITPLISFAAPAGGDCPAGAAPSLIWMCYAAFSDQRGVSSMKHIVLVWGKEQEVTATQKSKSVWIARGDYMGKSIEAKGTSASAAVAHWREAARYAGN